MSIVAWHPNKKVNYVELGLLTVASLSLGLFNLGNVALRDWDEGYYATVSQDMFQGNNWLFPMYQGQPFFLKPPLLFWLMQGSYHLGGINEWTSRLPTVAIASLAVPLIYLLGKEIFSKDPAPLLSACVYLTLLPIVRLGRLAMFDGIINTFLLGALWCLVQGLANPLWLMGVGVGLGLIALCKGILALVFLVLIVAFLLWEKRSGLLLNRYLWLGLGLGFMPAVLWYGLQIQTYGQEFIQVHFQSQSLDRLATAVEGHTGPVWYYLLEMLKYSAPWLFFTIPGVFFAWQQRRDTWAKLCLVMGLGFLLIISAMSTKLPWYCLPVYPFFALVTGDYLRQLWHSPQTYPITIGVLLLLCSLLAIMAGGYLLIQQERLWLSAISLTLAISLGITTVFFFRHNRRFITSLIGSLYLTLMVLVASPLWNWELNEAFAVKPIARLIAEQTPPDSTIYTSFAYSRPSLDFYADRLILAVDHDRLQELAQSNHYLLLETEKLETWELKNSQILGQSGDFTLVITKP